MAKLTKHSDRHNKPLTAPQRRGPKVTLPRYFLLSDPIRLPDPGPLLANLPLGACVILRHRDSDVLTELARRIVPLAHRRGLRVLLSDHVRLAVRVGADGVHFSQHSARCNRLRSATTKPGFLITAAAHDRMALWRADLLGAQAVLLSPVFATSSHPGHQPLGFWRFLALSRLSSVPVIALGGVNADTVKRVHHSPIYGFAAIDAWRSASLGIVLK